MLHHIAYWFYFKIMGWKIEGNQPNLDKCVFAVMPHTHWLDFPLGLLIRKVLDIEISYIGKKSLFDSPFGWFFRWMGGTPVDRSKNTNLVHAIAEIFKNKEVFRLALAPEGTRKRVSELKTGFYFIALEAKVPIILVAFDFGHKQIKFSEPFIPSGVWENDFLLIKDFYKGVIGKIPGGGLDAIVNQ